MATPSRQVAKTVIFSAPQAWGKTRNATKLQAEFGCTSVVDDWCENVPVTKGALHLTNVHPDQLKVIARKHTVVHRGW